MKDLQKKGKRCMDEGRSEPDEESSSDSSSGSKVLHPPLHQLDLKIHSSNYSSDSSSGSDDQNTERSRENFEMKQLIIWKFEIRLSIMSDLTLIHI